VFVLLWSTGFVSARYATDDAAPLTFLTIRLGVAAVVLAAIAALTGSERPSRVEVRWSLVAGVLFHAVYLGGVFLAIDRGLPTGVGALIAGLHPVVTALASGPLLGERLARVQWIGVALGFAGIVAVVADRLGAHVGGITAVALVCSVVSMLSMSAGTLVQRRHGGSTPLLWGPSIQYAAATVVLGVPSVAFESFRIEFTASTVFALLWATFVLSIAAVLLMLWLLQREAAAKVSSLFFLTPALSTVEGMILFDERLGALAVVGLVVSLAGVALVTRR
jgi:drug/metabolite transporter (DMT)-like permease